MADSQHGRSCSCSECAFARLARSAELPVRRETATIEQLRASYEAALDEMQKLCEAHPRADVFDPLRAFLTEAGRKLR